MGGDSAAHSLTNISFFLRDYSGINIIRASRYGVSVSGGPRVFVHRMNYNGSYFALTNNIYDTCVSFDLSNSTLYVSNGVCSTPYHYVRVRYSNNTLSHVFTYSNKSFNGRRKSAFINLGSFRLISKVYCWWNASGSWNENPPNFYV